MSSSTNNFNYRNGLGTTAAYQVSGRPFASGSIDASTAKKIEFPSVTRWIYLINHDASNDLICAFSEAGLPSNGGTNNFRIEDVGSTATTSGNTARLEMKVTEMWFESSEDFDVIAGLTSVETGEIQNNWSGSSGVG